jgi:hypothetical protein
MMPNRRTQRQQTSITQSHHYWYHIGENMAIRQELGHRDLPEFVGDIDTEAPYLPH